MIRTTNDAVRTLLIQASLPPRFWAEGLHTATYFYFRLTRWFSHLYLSALSLQVFPAHRHRFR